MIILYEFAQALSIFHTLMFWVFWYKSMYDYYEVKLPDTPINITMRKIILYVMNTLPPIFMLFDMVFSKIVFRLRHFWVGLLLSVLFFGVQYIGRKVLGCKYSLLHY